MPVSVAKSITQMTMETDRKPQPIGWEEGFFQNDKGLKFYFRYFPGFQPKQTLVIVHGHGEHSGRYLKFPNFLSDAQIAIAIFDMRGNGQSKGAETYVDSFEDYLCDLSLFVRFLKSQNKLKEEKILLLGHSLGGLSAIHWAIRNPEKIKGLILSSPCLGLKVPKVMVAFNQVMSQWFPQFIYGNPVYPPHLTHSQDEVLLYKRDKLIKRKISARLVDEMLRYMQRLKDMSEITVPFPVYVLMAGLERIVDNQATELFLAKLKAKRKEVQYFPNFFHEIFNELGQEKVFEVLKKFILLSGSNEDVAEYRMDMGRKK